MSKERGKIIQVVGVVIDVEFASEVNLPAIFDALTVKRGDDSTRVVPKVRTSLRMPEKSPVSNPAEKSPLVAVVIAAPAPGAPKSAARFKLLPKTDDQLMPL